MDQQPTIPSSLKGKHERKTDDVNAFASYFRPLWTSRTDETFKTEFYIQLESARALVLICSSKGRV